MLSAIFIIILSYLVKLKSYVREIQYLHDITSISIIINPGFDEMYCTN